MTNFTRANFALDWRKTLGMYSPGFHRQVVKHFKILSGRQKKRPNKRRTKGASLLRNQLTIYKMHILAL